MAMTFEKSAARVKAASSHVPGGVNSNFRAGISPTPLVVQKAEGAHVIDADGNRLIDYYLGMGAILLGHNPKPVVDAIRAQLEHGILYAANKDRLNIAKDKWVVGKDYSAAPTCATCHMSATPTQPVTHDVGTRISWTLRPAVSTAP